MTTPQSILYDIHSKINELISHFYPGKEDSEGNPQNNFLQDIEDIRITLNRTTFLVDKIRDRLDDLNVDRMAERIEKFEENYKRFEVMFNEFKGCVAMTRSNLMSNKRSET
jgi:hypothetical protein